MAILNTESPFQSWVFGPRERLAAAILSVAQKQGIQNQIVEFATKRINMTLEMTNTMGFMQQEAEIKGAIGALSYLLTLSHEAELELQTNQTSQEN